MDHEMHYGSETTFWFVYSEGHFGYFDYKETTDRAAAIEWANTEKQMGNKVSIKRFLEAPKLKVKRNLPARAGAFAYREF